MKMILITFVEYSQGFARDQNTKFVGMHLHYGIICHENDFYHICWIFPRICESLIHYKVRNMAFTEYRFCNSHTPEEISCRSEIPEIPSHPYFRFNLFFRFSGTGETGVKTGPGLETGTISDPGEIPFPWKFHLEIYFVT